MGAASMVGVELRSDQPAKAAGEISAGSWHSCVLRASRRFARDDSGQAITEYILLLALIMAALVAIANGMLSLLNTVTLAIGGELEKDLKTGRVPLSAWKN
jgi:Flp pilus assembly pilin Flp